MRSATATIWWAQTQLSSERKTSGVFLLGDVENREVTFVTNDWQVVDTILEMKAKDISLAEWFREFMSSTENWEVKTARLEVLDSICSQFNCVSAITEYSKEQHTLMFATVRFIKPEKVNSLSDMLLLFGVLHREPVMAVQQQLLHPVVSQFLNRMMETGKIDLAWLGYDKDNPDALIWKK